MFGNRCIKSRASNRPFPSSKKSHLQGEAKCEAIDMKMIFNYDAKKTHFHNKGFALTLVLKVRFFGTRKWPISEWHLVLSHDCNHRLSWRKRSSAGNTTDDNFYNRC